MNTGILKSRWFVLISVLVLCLLLFDLGYASGYKKFILQHQHDINAVSVEKKDRALTVYVDDYDRNSVFPAKTLGEVIDYNITYYKLNNVLIEIGGIGVKFEDAISSGRLTFSEIMYYAHTDAENGICKEQYESKNGLAHFTYCYPEFDLRIVNDIYETPDGTQHFIRDLAFFNPGEAIGAYTDFYNRETGERIDREDWGIAFKINSVTSTGVTLSCIQEGGQQVGNLKVSHYILCNQGGVIPTIENTGEAPSLNKPIQMNTLSEISLNWDGIYENLPSGEYEVLLYLVDEFDINQLHPLMNDYHTIQRYSIKFEISDATGKDFA